LESWRLNLRGLLESGGDWDFYRGIPYFFCYFTLIRKVAEYFMKFWAQALSIDTLVWEFYQMDECPLWLSRITLFWLFRGSGKRGGEGLFQALGSKFTRGPSGTPCLHPPGWGWTLKCVWQHIPAVFAPMHLQALACSLIHSLRVQQWRWWWMRRAWGTAGVCLFFVAE